MKKLLLHCCCAPCAITPHLYLKEEYAVTLFFYNPNIHDGDEFARRRDTFIDFAESEAIPYIVEAEYQGFDAWAKEMPRLDYPKRCAYCYPPRLEASAQKAVELACDVFTTSLLYSRYQQHELIIEQGKEMAQRHNLDFEARDFRPTWYEGIKLSKEKNMYRQKYCGCGLIEKEVE